MFDGCISFSLSFEKQTTFYDPSFDESHKWKQDYDTQSDAEVSQMLRMFLNFILIIEHFSRIIDAGLMRKMTHVSSNDPYVKQKDVSEKHVLMSDVQHMSLLLTSSDSHAPTDDQPFAIIS